MMDQIRQLEEQIEGLREEFLAISEDDVEALYIKKKELDMVMDNLDALKMVELLPQGHQGLQTSTFLPSSA